MISLCSQSNYMHQIRINFPRKKMIRSPILRLRYLLQTFLSKIKTQVWSYLIAHGTSSARPRFKHKSKSVAGLKIWASITITESENCLILIGSKLRQPKNKTFRIPNTIQQKRQLKSKLLNPSNLKIEFSNKTNSITNKESDRN